MNALRKLAVTTAASVGALSLGAAADAALLDFTDPAVISGTPSSPVVVTVAGVQVSITADPDQINTLEALADPNAPMCQSAGGDFACGQDGIGIVDDEISPGQSLLLEFDQAVNISSIAVLDLFEAAMGDSEESGLLVSVNGAEAATFSAESVFMDMANGFSDFTVGFANVTSIRFLVGEGNDDQGVADYALAGIRFEPVPIPAAGLLFLTALGGAGFARSRRKA